MGGSAVRRYSLRISTCRNLAQLLLITLCILLHSGVSLRGVVNTWLMQSSLDSFVTSSKSPPQPISTSQEVRDRGSVFIANIFKATSVKQVKDAIGYLRDIAHSAKPAHHEISAWRCMVLKSGRSGLAGEDDFEVTSGYNDDGERYAGERILKVMKSLGIIDAVVIVSRW
jgi:putative IMPACT (imprinted ancient) family translation regulator